MRRVFLWLPGREWELLLIALLHIGLMALTIALGAESVARPLVLVTLELGLPVALGVVTAGVLANDPVLELLLSVSQPPPSTLAQRLAALLGYGLVLATLMLLTAWALRHPLPMGGIRALLIWAAPTAFLMGVATVGALLRGKMLDGAALVLAVAGISLMSVTVGADCPVDSARPCYAALVTPLMTLLRPHDPLWLANRAIWMGVGSMLLLAGFYLARQEERLLTGAMGEE